jgi:predicted TPR repeat methyltransferase
MSNATIDIQNVEKASYFLPAGYQENLTANNSPVAAYSAPPPNPAYQAAVYRFAARLATQHKLSRILDVGCGSGVKVLRLDAPGRQITGLDDAVCIKHCLASHSSGRWLVENFDVDHRAVNEEFDLLICADVIEHVVYPDRLLNKIRQYSHQGSHIVISTPDRTRMEDKRPLGPPTNPLHVREWAMPELADLVRSQGFEVISHRHVMARDLTLREGWWELKKGNYLKACQMIHCRRTN